MQKFSLREVEKIYYLNNAFNRKIVLFIVEVGLYLEIDLLVLPLGIL